MKTINDFKYLIHLFVSALLSHQMEQLFKLESSLRAEKGEVDQLRHEVSYIVVSE